MIKTFTNWFLGAALFASLGLSAQVSQYSFSTQQGVYQVLDNPTVIASTPSNPLDQGVFTEELPFVFPFNGNEYQTVNIFTDGFVTFGSYTPAGYYLFKPIVSQEPHEAVLAVYNDDLEGLDNEFKGQISYQVLGTAPQRTFVIEWQNFARYKYTGYQNDYFKLNFQIRLNENGSFEYVYDVQAIGDPSVNFITVGIRGNNANDFAVRTTEDVDNGSWENTESGALANKSIVTDANNVPTSGLTFVYTPQITTDADGFCNIAYQYPNAGGEPITYVEFNTIANSSSADWASVLPHYEDFTSISAEVQKGNTYTLKLKGNTVGNNLNTYVVYIDWNGDNQFDNSANSIEKYDNLPTVTNSTGEDDKIVTYDITIPSAAVEQAVRMRIVKNFDVNATAPCGVVGDYGQVEDYTLQVLAGTATGNCTAVATFDFNFEDVTTENLFTDNCWNGNYTEYPTVSVTNAAGGQGNIPLPDKALQIYKSGTVTNEIILVTPEVTTTNGTHALSFDIEIPLAGTPMFITGEEKIQVGTMSDNNDFNTFVPHGDGFLVNQTGTFTTTPISFLADHKYVALKFELGTQGHKALILDNVKWHQTLHSQGVEMQLVSIYPNPATSTLVVQGINDFKQVTVFDISGKQILKTDVQTIDVQNLSNGMYILQIESQTGAVYTHKFLKK